MPQSQAVAEIIEKFINITQDKLVEVTNAKRHKVYNNPDTAEKYKEEKAILKSHTTPFLWGVGTAIAVFASFRISKYTGALRVKRRYGYGVGYEFENLKKGKSAAARGSGYGGNSGTSSNISAQQKISDLASLPADLFLSAIVGLSSAFFLTDVQKLQKDLSGLPLIKSPGRSLIAEELCDDFDKEYSAIPEKVLNTDDARSSESLQNLKVFVENCRQKNNARALESKEE